MISRRDTIRALGALPFVRGLKAQSGALDLRYRVLGRTGRWVVPYGLGGAVCMQWATREFDPPDIAVRAVELGINYLDCANNYGLSQSHYGIAFRRLHVTPDDPDYNQALRERLYITSKTAERQGSRAVTQLRNTLSVMFGDGKGYVPDGAYLDVEQIHQILTMQEVDQIYSPTGVMNALLDYRDGTNYTGLNPLLKRWIRHIGITGHQRSDVLMAMIRRDTFDAIDTVLTTVNPNDRNSACHQNNVIPLARARGLGIIAMKVMAAGVFFGGPLKHPTKPEEAIRNVGMPGGVPYADLLNYSLSTPGVACSVVGIGKIDREVPANDQLVANLTAVLASDPVSSTDRRRIETDVASVLRTVYQLLQ